jgi:hypothetical protein
LEELMRSSEKCIEGLPQTTVIRPSKLHIIEFPKP